MQKAILCMCVCVGGGGSRIDGRRAKLYSYALGNHTTNVLIEQLVSSISIMQGFYLCRSQYHILCNLFVSLFVSSLFCLIPIQLGRTVSQRSTVAGRIALCNMDKQCA